MAFLYSCPVRWADVDSLGHVNNVTYLDYLAEARGELFEAVGLSRWGSLDTASRPRVVGQQVTFAAPLTFRFRPVQVSLTIAESTPHHVVLETVVFDEADPAKDQAPVTYLHAFTTLRHCWPENVRAQLADEADGEGSPMPEVVFGERQQAATTDYPIVVRRSDLDVDEAVSDIRVFEYLQEARIGQMHHWVRSVPADSPGVGVVVARLDVEMLERLYYRPSAYQATSWLAAVGNSSFQVATEIHLDGVSMARARAYLVSFDAKEQKAAPLPAVYRDLLLGQLQE